MVDNMSCDKPKIIAVVGPTASGKTALSVGIGLAVGGEVVSCDSMQIYRGMDIGTAKPDASERRGVPHHLIDIVGADADFTAADYVEAAKVAVGDILARGAVPVFCGGTGLYLDAFLRGGFEETVGSPDCREALERRIVSEGIDAVYGELCRVDPESAERIHPNNTRRVIRALEIYYATGVTKSELDRRSRETEGLYDALIIGIRFPERDELYRRIDERVDKMMSDGLLGEVERLDAEGVFDNSRTAAQAIGYKELLPVVRGSGRLSDAVEAIKTATKHYAKRQMTWFNAHENIHWLDRRADTSPDELLDAALALIREGGIKKL